MRPDVIPAPTLQRVKNRKKLSVLLALDIDDLTAQSFAACITEPEETAMDVGDWLKSLSLEQYEAAFCENAVDAEVLPTLTGDDLKEMGVVPIGHRRRLLEAIAALRSHAMPAEAPTQVSSSAPTDPIRPPDASGSTAGRRPLSVMFCTSSTPRPSHRGSIPRT